MERRTTPARFEALINALPTILKSGFKVEEAKDHLDKLRNIGINEGVILSIETRVSEFKEWLKDRRRQEEAEGIDTLLSLHIR